MSSAGETTSRWRESSCFDVIVVGGGVVGCAVLRELTVHRGLCCMLVEASPHLVSGASSGNTGTACTEHDVAPGTLEYVCLQDASRLNVPTYQALNVPHRPMGSLYIGHSEADMAVLARKLEVRKSRGDSSASLVTADAARSLEPALNAGVVGGLVLPREMVVDPWLMPIAYALHAHENGASIQCGTKVTAATLDVDCWRLAFAPTLAHQTVPVAAETVAAYEVKINPSGRGHRAVGCDFPEMTADEIDLGYCSGRRCKAKMHPDCFLRHAGEGGAALDNLTCFCQRCWAAQ